MSTKVSTKAVLIAGPTASGKSALALALAERIAGVVINADSAQVYRDLSVVTARPTPEEEARAPHRLYGWRDAAEPCSAAEWAAAAREEIAAAHARGQLPILAGGTGLYIRTLLDGIAPVPTIDPPVRQQVRTASVEENRARLAAHDPEAAARLNAHPQFRVGIDGLDIHFVHARSPHEGALPLVLTHGWPGSFVEFLEVIGPLTNPADPADAFCASVKAALERGLYLMTHWNVIMIVPPLTITREEAEKGVAILDDVLALADEHYEG